MAIITYCLISTPLTVVSAETIAAINPINLKYFLIFEQRTQHAKRELHIKPRSGNYKFKSYCL